MAFYRGPKVVTNGLVLSLDAANTKSYPGSGTTWRDLSGIGNNGTLINGPTFSSANGGSIVFDGTNDGTNITASLVPTNTFTYEMWCIPTTSHQIDTESTTGFAGTSGQRYIIGATYQESPNSGAGVSIGTNGVSVYEHAPSYMPALLVSTTSLSNIIPTQVVIVYTNKQPSLYLNSVFNKTGLTSPRSTVYADFRTIGYGGYGYFQGSIYIVKTYNRALSTQEIAQNYNAQKSRFGL